MHENFLAHVIIDIKELNDTLSKYQKKFGNQIHVTVVVGENVDKEDLNIEWSIQKGDSIGDEIVKWSSGHFIYKELKINIIETDLQNMPTSLYPTENHILVRVDKMDPKPIRVRFE